LEQNKIKEGDVYQTIVVGGKAFIIRYGFYSEKDRKTEEPLPVFPDFITNPEFSECGKPFVTKIQDACEHYESLSADFGDNWCADCKYFENRSCDISLCTNPKCLKKTLSNAIEN